jgi:hypothetical protein
MERNSKANADATLAFFSPACGRECPGRGCEGQRFIWRSRKPPLVIARNAAARQSTRRFGFPKRQGKPKGHLDPVFNQYMLVIPF